MVRMMVTWTSIVAVAAIVGCGEDRFVSEEVESPEIGATANQSSNDDADDQDDDNGDNGDDNGDNGDDNGDNGDDNGDNGDDNGENGDDNGENGDDNGQDDDAGDQDPPELSGGLCDDNFTAADACGGVFAEGYWHMEEFCVQADFGLYAEEISADCSDGELTDFEATATGQLELGDDATFDHELDVDIAATTSVSDDCADAAGGCDLFAGELDEFLPGIGVGGCSEQSGRCECTLSGDVDLGNTGSYDVAQGVLEVDGGDAEYLYCAEDDEILEMQKEVEGRSEVVVTGTYDYL